MSLTLDFATNAFFLTPFIGATGDYCAAALLGDFKRAIAPANRLNGWCCLITASAGFAELERLGEVSR